ncbi:MAG: GTPase [Gaiellales bacterium]|nr:GTPase [Gaiellales bacterium]
MLVAVLRPDADPGELAEMRELLATAGAEVVGEVLQHRSAPDAKTYIGSGKVEELRARCKELQAEVVVCEDDLSPNQQRRLEDTLEMRVVDRTRVILDIFALHANSAEGKLQVELAQLEYNMQRMRGLWKHLERLGGGVGTRGPGESQLETDRRLARDRVALLKRRLKRVRAHRETLRKRRDRASLPGVALAGYTNVGKSTLLNALTGSTVSAADRLFHTLDPTTRAYDHLGRTYVVTDTVGFIRKLPHGLVEAFASTLEETLAGDLILHVCDASVDEDELAAQTAAVESVLEEIGAGELPRLLVLNKIDRCDEVTRRRLRNRHEGAVQVSAETGEGIQELIVEIAHRFAGRFERVELLVPFERGEVLGELYDLGSPIEREEEAEGVRVRAHLPRGIAARYAEFRVPERARDAAGGQ